jgi:hypothetical protein
MRNRLAVPSKRFRPVSRLLQTCLKIIEKIAKKLNTVGIQKPDIPIPEIFEIRKFLVAVF